MNEPKPFASLSSGLLARKGQARPAMRPQPYGSNDGGLDDLGWNDMGDAPPSPPSPRPALTPMQAAPAPIAEEVELGAGDTSALEEALASLSRDDTRGKAAFTLRLDAARHLRLRLACALNNRSAQQIVTEALDAFLESVPNLEALAGSLPTAAPVGRGEIKRGVGK